MVSYSNWFTCCRSLHETTKPFSYFFQGLRSHAFSTQAAWMQGMACHFLFGGECRSVRGDIRYGNLRTPHQMQGSPFGFRWIQLAKASNSFSTNIPLCPFLASACCSWCERISVSPPVLPGTGRVPSIAFSSMARGWPFGGHWADDGEDMPKYWDDPNGKQGMFLNVFVDKL